MWSWSSGSGVGVHPVSASHIRWRHLGPFLLYSSRPLLQKQTPSAFCCDQRFYSSLFSFTESIVLAFFLDQRNVFLLSGRCATDKQVLVIRTLHSRYLWVSSKLSFDIFPIFFSYRVEFIVNVMRALKRMDYYFC